MSTSDILSRIEHSAVAQAISKSDHLVGAGLQIFHILGFVLLLAAVVFINLRLLNLAFRREQIPQLSREPTRLIWWGLALAVASGVLMFASSPSLYFYKPIFQIKIALVLLAVVLQVLLFRKVAANPAPRPALARVSVVLSLLCWFSVGLAGRVIGFV